jgi:hypothetical protein
MIEVGLNLLWLLIVVASVATWACTRHRLVSKPRRQLSGELFGLAMAMALLWVPISVTDNFHPAILQAEDGGVTKRIAKSCARAHLLNHHGSTPPLAFFQSDRPALTLNLVSFLARYSSASLFITLPGNPPSNRAPPTL